MKKKKLHLSFERCLPILFVLYCFYSYGLSPYFTWETFGSGVLNGIAGVPFRTIWGLLIIVFGLLSVLTKPRKLNGKMLILSFWCFSSMTISIIMSGYTHIFSMEWVIYITLIVFLLSTNDVKSKSYQIFYNAFVIFLLIPIVVYILVHIGIPVPYTTIAAPEEIKTLQFINYKIYPFACQWYSPYQVGYTSLRLCGIYNECGVVGTYAAILLSVEEYKIKGNWKNIVLLIGGILSFSLAFYFLTICFFIVKAANFNRRYMIPLIAIIVIYFIFVNIRFHDEALLRLQNRFIFTDFVLNGDNRTSTAYDSLFDNFIHSGLYSVIFGKGHGEMENIMVTRHINGSSYKNLIYDYGIFEFINQIIWMGFYCIYMKRKKNRDQKFYILACFVIFCANLYQRPSMFALQYMLPIIGGLTYKLSSNLSYKGNADLYKKTSRRRIMYNASN